MSADTAQFILHHVQDGSEIQLPGGPSGFSYELFLKNTMHEGVMHHGLFGDGLFIGDIDVTPTKLTIMMWIASIALVTILLTSMKNRAGVPRGKLQNVVEALFLFVRDEIAVPNIGHEGHHYTPYLATCFFFILALNFLGLVPYGATATGNLGVTIVLASTAFVMTQIAGMRAQGVAGYWLHLVPAAVPKWLYPVMVPVELIGLITKPFALMMRLFANMVAGHLVLFFLIALIFFIGHVGVAIVAIPMAFAIFLLEIFVALLQAYVFTLLTSVFIGMTQHAH